MQGNFASPKPTALAREILKLAILLQRKFPRKAIITTSIFQILAEAKSTLPTRVIFVQKSLKP
jgi:hypothetical protein